MLLAIDIGNSLIKFGVFEGARLFDKFSISTKRDYRPKELQFDRLRYADGRFLEIHTVVVSTVVPELKEVVRRASQKQFKATPVFVDHAKDFGLVNKCEPLESVGIDRLVNASAAARKYGKPVIVCSFGTATVIDAVNKHGEFLGGIIAPGLRTMADSLQRSAAQLPAIEIEKPKGVIGNTTAAAIRSGVVNGHIAMTEGLIKRFLTDKQAFGSAKFSVKVIATGGFAPLIAPHIKAITKVDENLTLNGLRLLADA